MKTRTIKNPTELGGMLGENVAVKKKGKKVVLTNRPTSKIIPLAASQVAAQERFEEAARYAGRQLKNPTTKDLYESGITQKKRTAFLVAFSDFLVAPTVREIEASEYTGKIGEEIVVNAKDDFMVTAVKVVITASDGSVIEKGQAIQDPDRFMLWKYTTTVANPDLAGTSIKALASDNAGNVGNAVKTL
jgi:hypothetical protein